MKLQNIRSLRSIKNYAVRSGFMVLVAVLTLSMSGTVNALSSQQQLLRHGVRYFNIKSGVPCSANANPSTTIVVEGSDDAERVYNFLTAKGLKPFQAAGVMGNMQVESGIQPQRLQGTGSGVITSVNATPVGWNFVTQGSGNITSSSTGKGWGLVQWTPARKFVATQVPNTAANNIGNQLQFLWEQLEGGTPAPEKRAGDDLKATTSLEQAVLAFQGGPAQNIGGQTVGPYPGYERPADKVGSIPDRYSAAKRFLALYGNNAPSSDPTSTTTSANTCPGGATAPGDGTGTDIPSGDAVTLAKQILASSNLSFQTGSGRAAFQRFADSGKTACGVVLSPTLLGIILKLSESYQIVLGVFQEGHGPCSESGFHPKGAAVDINGVNPIGGGVGTGTNIRFEAAELPILREFYKRAGEVFAANGGGGFGQVQCFGGPAPRVAGITYFNDGCNHLHMDTRGK